MAKEFGIPVQFQRFWLWAKRQNHTYRPNRPLTPQEEVQSVSIYLCNIDMLFSFFVNFVDLKLIHPLHSFSFSVWFSNIDLPLAIHANSKNRNFFYPKFVWHIYLLSRCCTYANLGTMSPHEHEKMQLLELFVFRCGVRTGITEICSFHDEFFGCCFSNFKKLIK